MTRRPSSSCHQRGEHRLVVPPPVRDWSNEERLRAVVLGIAAVVLTFCAIGMTVTGWALAPNVMSVADGGDP